MLKYLLPAMVYGIATFIVSSCNDPSALAESSFGKLGATDAKASSVSVISMGRDDDDGHAKKWHIGGSEIKDLDK